MDEPVQSVQSHVLQTWGFQDNKSGQDGPSDFLFRGKGICRDVWDHSNTFQRSSFGKISASKSTSRFSDATQGITRDRKDTINTCMMIDCFYDLLLIFPFPQLSDLAPLRCRSYGSHAGDGVCCWSIGGEKIIEKNT